MRKEIKEAIELLETASGDICEAQMNREKFDSLSLARQKIAHALTKLRSIKAPEPTEFAKDFREQVGRQAVGIGSLGEIRRMAIEACAIINQLQSRLDRAEAINKDLLEACEKVQDWLDTSSLQQVLVHYTEDSRRHALIMGIASNLDRLEAAIAKAAKAKKEG